MSELVNKNTNDFYLAEIIKPDVGVLNVSNSI